MTMVITSVSARIPLAEWWGSWNGAWRRGEPLGARVDSELIFGSLLDLLPSTADLDAVCGLAGKGLRPMNYADLWALLAAAEVWRPLGVRPGDRCAIALPDGPTLAVALLGVSMRCTAVPMNPWNPEAEIAADCRDAGVTVVVTLPGSDFDHIRRAAHAQGIRVVEVRPDPVRAGHVDLLAPQITSHRAEQEPDERLNGPADIALELFTSGTSGRKKRVPIRFQDLLVGSACIAAALELGPGDRGYNMMPLFHVGGIVRNLFAPLLAGTAMVYSEGFDPVAFWDQCEHDDLTWYYASPTMHEAILDAGKGRSSRHLRFICNAAGDLLPSIAARLRERFDAAILPGYGMTECMPIALPPLDYQLERKGASGRILGPEVRIMDAAGVEVPAGSQGRIMLRGAPVARIVQDRPATGEAEVPDGWFDTGDLGRFDEDGYLYIVGRGKDVIKRGGETIAPAEIEDALVTHPDIASALVFAVPHETLGEAVGCVIVPRGERRPDLGTLTTHLADRLAPVKWPVLIVYMEALPKNVAGKLLRVGLASRLGLGLVDDTSAAVNRLLWAQCPAPGTPLTTAIPAVPVQIRLDEVEGAIRRACPTATGVVVICDEILGALRALVEVSGVEIEVIRTRLRTTLHDYLIPQSIALVETLPRTAGGAIDKESVRALIARPAADVAAPSDEVEAYVVEAWRERLGRHRDVHVDSDFFDDLGGGSLTAVQIIADIRTHYGIALSPTAIFRSRTARALATVVRTEIAALPTTADASDERVEAIGGPAAKSSRSMRVLATQLIPLTVLPVVLRLGQLVGWIALSSALSGALGSGAWWVMVLALVGTGLAMGVACPLIAIGTKWTLIGRYRSGMAPLWSQRYLRWWLARQVQATLGLGVFSLSYPLTALYYRLLGAKVGHRTRIAASADLGEYDLLTIGDGAVIDEGAIVRPFVMQGGAMDFKPIRFGADVSIGTRATVVPGSDLPAGTEIAPLASSDNPRARNQGTRALSRALVYAPPASLKGLGLAIKATLVVSSWLPIVLLLHAALGGPIGRAAHHGGATALLLRMLGPQRIAVSVVVLMVSTLTSGFVYLAGVIAVKWIVIGRFRACDDVTRPWPMFERWLMWRLLPDGRFGGVATILGQNFAAISVIYRLLGAKVGKRIYWPGSGNVITEYDLFECGDDVTFGSRSTYLMTSAGGSRAIRIEDGANVADRCVLAPGVTVGRNAVLGSGTFAPEGFHAEAGSTWIGQNGRQAPLELEAASPRRAGASTSRPYARAMYDRDASYRVLPLIGHILVNVVSAVTGAVYCAAPMIGALLLTRGVLLAEGRGGHTILGILALLVIFYAPLQLLSAFGALAFSVLAKWLIVGRREPGEHFWDRSSYCQRWKIHSSVTSWSSSWSGGRDLLAFFEGSALLVTYFRAQGATIGNNVCLYPNGADPMMEEPDLVTIGDGACVDQAVLIAHLNTRGEWTMGPIDIGAGATLRAASRVMMMGTVGKCGTLLEGTLLLAGDASLASSTWEGWPGQAVSATALSRHEDRAADRGDPAARGDHPCCVA